MEREYPGRFQATTLTNPDFAALARAYGCWAETVERTEISPRRWRGRSTGAGSACSILRTDIAVISKCDDAGSDGGAAVA